MKSPRSGQTPDHAKPLRRLAVALALLVALVAGLAVSAAPASAADLPASTTTTAAPADTAAPAAPADAVASDPAPAASDALVPFVTPGAPITDYANYPDAITPSLFPAGCSARGPAILTGTTFTVNGVSAPDLGSFTLSAGDTVTMTWTGFAPGCDTVGISLSAKRADAPFFQPGVNQELIPPFGYCGPGGSACDPATGLSLTVPARRVACNFQLDAVIGPPLSVVGPGGSFYDSSIRGSGSNMLISSNNGGAGVNCGVANPQAAVAPSCGTGAILIDLTNTGTFDSSFSVTVDGTNVFTGTVAPNGTHQVSVPAAEDSTHQILVTADGQTIFDQAVLQNCLPPTPTVTAAVDCAQGGVAVVVTNPDTIDDVTVDILSDGTTVASGVVVAAGQTVTTVVPLAEGATATISVVQGGQTAFTQPFTRNCTRPTATAVHSCAQGGVVVTLTNGAAANLPAQFSVAAGSIVENRTVQPGESTTVLIPVVEGATVQVVVTEASEPQPLLDQPFTADCFKPVATAQNHCDAGDIQIVFGNSGELPVDLTVTQDGKTIATVTVPAGGTLTAAYPQAEDTTSVWRVSGPGYDSGDMSILHDCIQGSTDTLNRTLARTGSSTGPLVGLGLLLMLLGSMLLAISTRPIPAFVPTFVWTFRGRAVPPNAYWQPLHLARRGWFRRR
ncbi:MAG: hypothetical protein QOK06_2278 [Acidimicrobiaceae bacterium]